MSCWETVADYGLRSIGIGERLLPREGYTLCQQFTLIGSGMIWNIYFIPGITALYPVLLRLFPVPVSQAALTHLRSVHVGVARGIDRAVPEHRCLFRRDFLRRTAIRSARRYRSG